MQTQRSISVEEICRKLRPIFGNKIDEIYFRYSVSESKEEKEELMHFLSALYQKNLDKLLSKGVLLEPPEKENVSGEYPLAVVNYAGRQLFQFALREEDWPRHVCISGMSGSGKTTFAYHVLRNFSQKNKPFLVFDWKKSFRPLINHDDSLVLFTVGDDAVTNRFKMNILRAPEGISAKEWITVLSDLLAESFSVSFGVHKILVETIDELYEGWKIYEEEEKLGYTKRAKFYPTFEHVSRLLEDKMKKSKGREATWLESAMRIASVLTFGSFGKVVNYEGKKSVNIEDIINKRVILEMNSLGTIEKKFFCEFILTYLYKMNKSRENSFSDRNEFKYAILVDEAHNIFLKDKTNFVRESVTDMIYREMREYGTALICLDQHVSKLSDTVKGNSACHIAFQQQLPEDMNDISRIMQLPDKREMFSQLKIGTAIVKLSDRYTSPFLIEVSDASKLRSSEVTNENIKSRFRSFLLGLEVEKGEDKKFNEDLINPDLDSDNEKDEVKGAFFKPAYAPEVYVVPYSPQVSIEVGNSNLVKNVRFVDETKEDEDESEYEKQKAISVYEIIESIQNESKEKVNEIPEIPINHELEDGLTSKQKVLVDFIRKRQDEGESLNDIEIKLRVYNVRDSACLNEDIDRAFGLLSFEKKVSQEIKETNMENKKDDGENGLLSLDQKVSPEIKEELSLLEKEKLRKEKTNMGTKMVVEETEKVVENFTTNEDEGRFLDFVRGNPNHELSTVDLYKIVNLSTRKGNVIKNKLLDKGFIKIEEKRSKAGWKKFIKPVFTI